MMPLVSLLYKRQEKLINREKHKICLSIPHERINIISVLESYRFPIMSLFTDVTACTAAVSQTSKPVSSQENTGKRKIKGDTYRVSQTEM